jgi:Glucosamine-6-phosphate isomerases/6-phosphogluconolactonase
LLQAYDASALHETKRLVVSNWVGKFFTDRITMTPPILNHAACAVFLVSGEEKALPLKAVLEGPFEPEQLPAQLVRPDAAGSSGLSIGTPPACCEPASTENKTVDAPMVATSLSSALRHGPALRNRWIVEHVA